MVLGRLCREVVASTSFGEARASHCSLPRVQKMPGLSARGSEVTRCGDASILAILACVFGYNKILQPGGLIRNCLPSQFWRWDKAKGSVD